MKKYKYTNNRLENNLEKPKAKYFTWRNKDIYNSDLTDIEYRLLQAFVSMKGDSKQVVKTSTLAKKFKKSVKTIERTMEKLIKNKYIAIHDGRLILLRTGEDEEPLAPFSTDELTKKYVNSGE
jgi:hypothetical protein